jgi:hypothetical protein
LAVSNADAKHKSVRTLSFRSSLCSGGDTGSFIGDSPHPKTTRLPPVRCHQPGATFPSDDLAGFAGGRLAPQQVRTPALVSVLSYF